MTAKPSTFASTLGVVILAAGRSTRMGRPKLLLPWGATSVIGHLVELWTELGSAQIAVVAAADDQGLRLELDRLSFPAANRIENPSPEQGMFSSIHCAATWNGWNPALSHFAIALGDQPHLAQATLRALVEFASRHPDRICQPAYASRPRHPVLLPKAAFLDLATDPRTNLKSFLSGRAVVLCEVNDRGLDLDIDRPEDYQRALELAQAPDAAPGQTGTAPRKSP